MIGAWLRKLHSVIYSDRMDDELDEEIRIHLELATEDFRRRGMSPEDARLAARRSFGGVEQVRERHRDTRRFRWLADLHEDGRLAVRNLLRDRGFTAMTVSIIALAIAANTAIFAVVESVLLRPLPYPSSGALVSIVRPGGGEIRASDPIYHHFREGNRSLEELGAFQSTTLPLAGQGEPTQVSVGQLSNAAFAVLGVAPIRGRLPSEEEDVGGGPLVAVLSHALWVTRFGSDPSVLGREIRLGDQATEVIGIMPPEFGFPSSDIDLWIPLQMDPDEPRTALYRHQMIGRLRRGANIEAAGSDIERLIASLDPSIAGMQRFTTIHADGIEVRTLKESRLGGARRLLWLVFGAALFMLLIALTNVANLFLVRTDARAHQSAVRSALGATRGRLVRSLLAENAVVALLGGIGGLVLSFVCLRVLLAISPPNIPGIEDARLNATVVLYTAGVSALACLLLSILPVRRIGQNDTKGVIANRGTRSTVGRGRLRYRGLLIGTEAALAVVLLIGAGLTARSFGALRSVDPGFEPVGVLKFGLTLPAARYPDADARMQFLDQLLSEVRALPGVASAGATTVLPFEIGPSYGTDIEEYPTGDESAPAFAVRWVTPGFFETLRIQIVSGRSLERSQQQARDPVLFISESLRDEYWPANSALGKRLRPAGIRGRVAGVVGDVHTMRLDEPPWETIYLPVHRVPPYLPQPRWSVVVRSGEATSVLVPMLKGVVHGLDGALPLAEIELLDHVVADSMGRRRFAMLSLAFAALVSLVLAAVGVFAVISYVVSQRRAEMGLRLALGAAPTDVGIQVLRAGLVPAVAGIALGVGAAVLTSSVLTPILFGIGPLDTVSFVVGPLVLVAVAAAACVGPGRKAAGLDPSDALRSL